MNTIWSRPSSWTAPASIAMLAGDILYIARLQRADVAALEEDLNEGEPPEEVFGSSFESVPLSQIRELVMNPVARDVSVCYGVAADSAKHAEMLFVDDQQMAEAWSTLKGRLGAGWQERTERQSSWQAAAAPCKALLLLVGLPLLIVLAGAAGGQASVKSFGELLVVAWAVAAAVLAVVGYNYWGIAPVIGIGFGLLGLWLMWLFKCLATRPDVVRLRKG